MLRAQARVRARARARRGQRLPTSLSAVTLDAWQPQRPRPWKPSSRDLIAEQMANGPCVLALAMARVVIRLRLICYSVIGGDPLE